MSGDEARPRDQLSVSRRIKGDRQGELSRVVRHARGRNIITPWHSGRKPPARKEKSMPFKSQAQRRLFYAKADRGEISKGAVKEWESKTPKDKKLPERKKSAAHAYGLMLGIQTADVSTERKLLMLNKAAADVGLLVLPELVKQSGLWLLEQEQAHPGFMKYACTTMEKCAQDPKVQTRITPEQASARYQIARKGGAPHTGTMGKIFSFLQKNKWVLPMAMMAMGGGMGGMGGMALGGLGGYMAQRYLPQMAAWGLRQQGPWGKAFTQQQLTQQLQGQQPTTALTGAVGRGAWQHAKANPLQAVGDVGQLAGASFGPWAQVAGNLFKGVTQTAKGFMGPQRNVTGQ